MIEAPASHFRVADAARDTVTFDEAARERARSGASWGAILAGAVVAVSVSLLLMILGTGLGFALSAGAFTVAGTIWLIVTQWLSAAAGGYIAGRLRHRWLATHVHEAFFRDTAHGLVTWSLATLIVAAVLAGSMSALLGGAARTAGVLAAVGGRGVAVDNAYEVDKLLRGGAAPAAGGSMSSGVRAQVEHIAANVAVQGTVSDADRDYLGNLVASSTGIGSEEARQRVDTFMAATQAAAAKAKEDAQAARKDAAEAALYTALALLIGAFIASVAAAIGGRLRDEHA